MKSGLILLFLASFSQSVSAACEIDQVSLRGDWGSARFSVEIADEPQERNLGLMNRTEMAQSAGMLFIYDTPVHATFWMRNTLIPLDMVFITPQGVVSHIHENAIPLDETLIDGGRGVLAVLEINGGLSDAIGIDVGTEIQHPAFEQGPAAWPCENFSK